MSKPTPTSNRLTPNPTNSLTKPKAKAQIFEVIKREDHETTQELIKQMHECYAISLQEIETALAELEKENVIHFAQAKQSYAAKDHVFSKKAAWYWLSCHYQLW